MTNADYIACHFQEYVKRFNMLDQIKEGGTFVLNSRWTLEDMEKEIPADFRRKLYNKKVKFYNVDARSICDSFGLGKRIERGICCRSATVKNKCKRNNLAPLVENPADCAVHPPGCA